MLQETCCTCIKQFSGMPHVQQNRLLSLASRSFGICNEVLTQCAGELAESSWAWTLQMPGKTILEHATRMPNLAAIRAQVKAELSVHQRLRGFTLTWQPRKPACSTIAEVSREADRGEQHLNACIKQ